MERKGIRVPSVQSKKKPPSVYRLISVSLRINQVTPELVDEVSRLADNAPDLFLMDVRRREEGGYTIIKFAGPLRKVLNMVLKMIRLIEGMVRSGRIEKTVEPPGIIPSIVFSPVRALSLDECRGQVSSFFRKHSDALPQPVFLDDGDSAAAHSELKRLLKSGEFDRLDDLLSTQKIVPDFGPPVLAPGIGLSKLLVKKYVVTFGIMVNTRNLDVVQEIADELSYRGRILYDKNGEARKNSAGEAIRGTGRFQTVEAMATAWGSNDMSQVICRLGDFENPDLMTVYRTTQALAREYLLDVLGGIIIGYLPYAAIRAALRQILTTEQLSTLSFREQMEKLIEEADLNVFGEFIPDIQIIDLHFLSAAQLFER